MPAAVPEAGRAPIGYRIALRRRNLSRTPIAARTYIGTARNWSRAMPGTLIRAALRRSAHGTRTARSPITGTHHRTIPGTNLIPRTTVIFPVRSGSAGTFGRRRTALPARIYRPAGTWLTARPAGRRLLRTGRLCCRLLRALLPSLPVSVAAGAGRLLLVVVLRYRICLVAARRAVAA